MKIAKRDSVTEDPENAEQPLAATRPALKNAAANRYHRSRRPDHQYVARPTPVAEAHHQRQWVHQRVHVDPQLSDADG
jgi:hypothetical protein